ncbi:DUF1499 domain-containing protein [Vibrio aestuarianus]|uniref:DUF1499 domain-containing protein n=1 Tax=Vibrio aestuarianus TaxID=28171 RepID=UPI00237D064C|nr:DUF1499 domain-containing protein [Vibrio aestuarianus]MDE1210860.1 DUF1499 domain-containing protein [Vibrio aestuarianus]
MRLLFSLLLFSTLTACSQGVTTMTDRTATPCGDKPNCVSTQDDRNAFSVSPFILKASVSLDQIEAVALSIPRSKTASKEDNYLRIEYTSRIMRFVDDLELKIDKRRLIVRSESRIGYSDMGVNRKRVELLRENLTKAGLLE